ncbi:XAC0095 family protein [Lysobacter panacisoli]|uniref:XAC0095-like domain-containing protein n=1 Tax=Lysobacter panacisoli TaxID=1255263 RepID=A0ABP9LSX4_9GAMM|nr:hypothetical protein [Lysobacter panacisoli]
MRNGPRNTTAPMPSYVLPLDAYLALTNTRDHLRLLSELAEPRNDDDRDRIVVTTDALAQCFDRLAGALDEALERIERQ